MAYSEGFACVNSGAFNCLPAADSQIDGDAGNDASNSQEFLVSLPSQSLVNAVA